MFGWFLSYNSQDLALMRRLEAALRQRDAEAKIFFAPTSLRAGGFWLPELAKGIAEATAFVLLVGEKGLGQWQVIEYYEALDRRVKQHDFPVILILLDGWPAPGLPFLRQLHWIVTADPASEKSVAALIDAAAGRGSPPGELWRHTAPYRGLAAMEEKDSDYFFGRTRETVEVLNALAVAPDELTVLIGNSGVGKSSLAQAGVLAALRRQAWPQQEGTAIRWPHVFDNSRRWSFFTLRPGNEPVRSLIEVFLETWQLDTTRTEWPELLNDWTTKLIDGKLGLRDLLDQTRRRYAELQQPEPAAHLVYVDQGEELYVRAEPRQRSRFSEILAEGLADPRLRMLMSLRADFFGELQRDEPLDNVSRKIEVKPLREAQLLEVVTRPAAELGARFESDHLAGDISKRTAEESAADAGAVTLLSYFLDDMWKSKEPNWDGILRLPAQSIDLGRVLVQRADAFLARNPNAEEKLRRILTLKLATVREDSEPTRRRAFRSEFSDEEWRLVGELADHPNRLVVTAAPEAGETYTEVAHEAIFRRWDKLREWIAAEREFLAWRNGLEAARRAWQRAPVNDALLMGLALTQARSWLARRSEDLAAEDLNFILLSRKAARRRQLMLAGGASAMIIIGLAAWAKQDELYALERYLAVARPFVAENIRPYVKSADAEQGLVPDAYNSFRECAPKQQDKDYCPDMIVIPAGSFAMGSPMKENGHDPAEEPQHTVTIAKPFAVSKYELTFDEWDTCVNYGDCTWHPSDVGWKRGQQPVIYVSWNDAKQYVAWLGKVTGKPYRLLSESEYEYATRAGTATAYPWGDAIGRNNANCDGCDGMWGKQTAPVDAFAPNKFGLYGMVGNVWAWVEDCVSDNYIGAPADGSPSIPNSDCKVRVIRGGSWLSTPASLRSAARNRGTTDARSNNLGFRVGRSLGSGGEAPDLSTRKP